jgi:glycosyltransferase involved in cell wall biosynthesis
MIERVAPAPAGSLVVLQVLGNAITGGMETYVGNLLSALPRRIVPVVLAPFASAMTDRWQAAGHAVHIGPVDDEEHLMTSVERVVELVRRTGAHVVHSHLGNANAVCSIAAEICGIPAIATIHSRHLTLRDVEALRLGRAHALVVSESAYAQARLLGLEQRTTWIPNGVDTARFAPREGTAPRARCTIGFIGRLAAEKGPLDFVALAAALGGQASRARFVMYGDGPLRDVVLDEIGRLRLEGVVELMGVVDDMPAVYRGLDILVSTSVSEGSPLAILEAMASGIPVVAAGVGGVPEIVSENVTGRVVPPQSIEPLMACVGELIADPATRVAFGTAGRARVEKRYSMHGQVAGVLALIERLTGCTAPAAVPSEAPRGELRLARPTVARP